MREIAKTIVTAGFLIVAGSLVIYPALGHGPRAASGEDGHHRHMEAGQMPRNVDEMRASHRGHKHGHDFQAMEEMSPERRARVMALMHDIGVAMPPMDPERGRRLFVEKGCVACHAVRGIGGDLGPTLNASDMPRPMNAFEFAARMWRGAQAMTALQEELLGEVISTARTWPTWSPSRMMPTSRHA